MPSFTKPILALAAGVATTLTLVATISPAGARQPDAIVEGVRGVPTASVRYDHLNLLSAAGQKALRQDVGQAVDRLCAINGTTPIAEKMEARSCRTFAWSSAEPQIERALANARSSNGLASVGATVVVAAKY